MPPPRTERGLHVKVRAMGDKDLVVGYYNHLRRHGGDVFRLSPLNTHEKVPAKDKDGKPIMDKGKPKMVDRILTPREQFSSKWMEEVEETARETKPQHFNKVGRGDARREHQKALEEQLQEENAEPGDEVGHVSDGEVL